MSVKERLVKLGQALVPLIFVPRCASCLEVLPSKNDALCKECAKIYELESKYICSACGRPHRFCTCKLEFEGVKTALVHVTAYDIKRNSVSKSIILNLKDTKYPGAFDFFARELHETVKMRYVSLLERNNFAVSYVPRSEKARKSAGHDQSYEIATRFARLAGVSAVTLFENLSDEQQKKLDAKQRIENAKANYVLADEELDLSGKIVLIIDDITTTGSSLGACAALAKGAGARAVIALVCARAESKGSVQENDYFINGEEENVGDRT